MLLRDVMSPFVQESKTFHLLRVQFPLGFAVTRKIRVGVENRFAIQHSTDGRTRSVHVKQLARFRSSK